MANMLDPGAPAGPGAKPPPAVNGVPNPLAAMKASHDQLSAQYSKLEKAERMLDKVRRQLDSLGKLGDTVQPEDVVKSAGALVAAGMEPAALASLLSSMPQGGEALRDWIAAHDADVTAREAHLDQVKATFRHELATSSIRGLMVHGALEGLPGHAEAAGATPRPGPSPERPVPSENPLAGPTTPQPPGAPSNA